MFENTTKFDLNLRLEVSSLISKKICWLFYGVGIFLFGSGIFLYVFYKSNEYYLFLLDGIIISLLGVLLHYLINSMIKKEHNNSVYKGNNTLTHYVFDEKSISQKVISGGEIVFESIIIYEDILRVLETNKYILLYFSYSNCFAVKKDGMTVGDYVALRNFLKTKISKYDINLK